MHEHEYANLLFAYNAEVPFTNNCAERDLRMGKVEQKVSGCFRQEQYAAADCRISSYLQTMVYRGSTLWLLFRWHSLTSSPPQGCESLLRFIDLH